MTYLSHFLCGLLLVSASAMARPLVELTVSADIVPAACVVSLDNGGIVDFGSHFIGALSATKTNQLGSREITLSIQCEAPRQVAWTIDDEKAESRASAITVDNAGSDGQASSDSSTHFGLGLTSQGKPIGVYTVSALVSKSRIDGQPGQWIFQVPLSDGGEGQQWQWLQGSALLKPGAVLVTAAAVNGEVQPATTLHIPLKIAVAIEAANKLAISDNVYLTGEATIRLTYL